MSWADIDIGAAGSATEIRLQGSEHGFAFGDAALTGIRRDAPVALGIRPEAVLLSHSKTNDHLSAVTTNIEPLGSHDIVDVKIGGQTLRARTESGFVAGEGQEVWVKLLGFDDRGKVRLSMKVVDQETGEEAKADAQAE